MKDDGLCLLTVGCWLQAVGIGDCRLPAADYQRPAVGYWPLVTQNGFSSGVVGLIDHAVRGSASLSFMPKTSL